MMSFVKLMALLPVMLAAVAPLTAQRQPVLRQVRVPHPYYYREMYLPQLTTGPSSVAWSPDGRELVYSMRGSLWRQQLGRPEARQLTAESSYDYQPDWSPDGRSIVYASYRNDAVELRLLDLKTGTSRTLVANGAVNVEPRWSPDGSRVAFVSSAHQGRWHIFVAAISGGVVTRIDRLTEDRPGQASRYYYHRYDQYLSPTWSPDGSELIFISNRGRVWGSGGFWRMAARPGAEPRELWYEETTWKARPDWSRDGHRVVYGSYLGRQWHQLWLMTSEGGDPFQLTYQPGDAISPRWSPDGSQIAYISNLDGNTSLRLVQVPGGRSEEVRVVQRIYREPVGRIRVTVIDGSSGRPTPARVSVRGPDGRSFAPDDAWQHADDGFDRSERAFEYGYFHSPGRSLLTVPAGPVNVEVSRGPEFQVVRQAVQVAADSTSPLRVVLRRIWDLPRRGWYSADLHVHMNYGGAYRNTPARLAAQARAEDVHLVENLIVNKEGRIPDIGYFTGRPDPVSTTGTIIVHDQEYHTSFWGHTGLLGLRGNLILPGYAAYPNTAAASPNPTNSTVFDLAREQGAITGYVHPFDTYPEPGDSSKPLTHELPVGVALGKVDYYEALGFVDDYEATARVWYRLLNCGFRIPAGGGTDAMANFASLRGPVGMNRTYVRSDKLDQRRWLAGLKAGRSFATNGPLLAFSLDGKGLGKELSLPAGGATVTAEVTLRSFVPIDHLEIVSNGRVVLRVPLAGDRTMQSTRVAIPVRESGWYILRARGDGAVYPVLDAYPYATTSPIYVIVGGRPIRSSEDAEYFLSWIARLDAAARQHRGWNSEEEKSRALEQIAGARKEFELRLSH